MPTQTGVSRLYDRFAVWRLRSDPRSELLEALHTHAGLVISTAARVLGNLADAEDIAQDIAEKLLRSPPDGVRSWPALLKTMAVNTAIDRLRRRRDWSELEPPEDAPAPDSVLSDEQRAVVLRRAVANLSERDGELFSLHYFADLIHAEIADRMGISANAVGVALHRLRKRLADDVRARLRLNEQGDIEQ